MNKLPEKYRKNGYDFTLVERTEDVAIYKQTDETSLIAYEVFEVMKYPERMIGETKIAATEASPSNEMWGSKGYTYRNLEDAKERAGIIGSQIEARKLGKRISPEFKTA